MPIFGIVLDIGNMSDRAVQDDPTYRKTAARTHRERPSHDLQCLGVEVVQGDGVELLAIEAEEPAEESVAQSHGAADDRVEYRLLVRRRARDHAEDFARRRLLV